MNALSAIQVALALLYSTLAQYKSAGAAAGIIENIESAISKLLEAHTAEVDQGGLEALRVVIPAPDWSNIKP